MDTCQSQVISESVCERVFLVAALQLRMGVYVLSAEESQIQLRTTQEEKLLVQLLQKLQTQQSNLRKGRPTHQDNNLNERATANKIKHEPGSALQARFMLGEVTSGLVLGFQSYEGGTPGHVTQLLMLST